ncbi:MAG: hypothetical protein EBU82_12745 [Flavobacteriia bacterium]|jgi:hypothetical protein|nr:hypothetical protein [Flavobacteriia bacterium]
MAQVNGKVKAKLPIFHKNTQRMSENTRCWLVGNHANSVAGKIQNGTHVNYRLNASLEDCNGSISFSPNEKEENLPYLTDALQGALEKRMSQEASVVLVGDISERLMEAAIHAGISCKKAVEVFVLYPVGMVALDVRKEMAEVILTLKKAEIPTFLVRNPSLFFSFFEPNDAPFVRGNWTEEQREVVEYLCGQNEVEQDN